MELSVRSILVSCLVLGRYSSVQWVYQSLFSENSCLLLLETGWMRSRRPNHSAKVLLNQISELKEAQKAQQSCRLG